MISSMERDPRPDVHPHLLLCSKCAADPDAEQNSGMHHNVPSCLQMAILLHRNLVANSA
jgi:hypothetical protein